MGIKLKNLLHSVNGIKENQSLLSKLYSLVYGNYTLCPFPFSSEAIENRKIRSAFLYEVRSRLPGHYTLLGL